MGACASFKRPVETSLAVHPCLIMGPHAAGKTALVRHLQIVYGHFETSQHRAMMAPLMRNVVVEAINEALDLIRDFDTCSPGVVDRATFDTLQRAALPKVLTMQSVDAVLTLWRLSSFHDVLTRMPDSYLSLTQLAVLMDALPRVAAPDYVPTDSDLVRLQYPSTGLTDTLLPMAPTLDHLTLLLVDSGGRVSERDKWRSRFRDCRASAVVFVVALDSFAYTSVDDAATNQLSDAVALITHACQDSALHGVPRWLLLNKRDAFAVALAAHHAAFQTVFPEFTGGPGDVKGAIHCIRKACITACPELEHAITVASCVETDTSIRRDLEKFCIKHL
jgi:hypothetical protein